MDSKQITNSEAKFDSYLSSLGFLYPITEKELLRFNKIYNNFKFELDGSEVLIQKIFEEVTNEERTANDDSVLEIVKPNQYFKRAVLAAEIASQLYNEFTFGHVKFQKIVFLCEHVSNMEISGRYSKQIAGPYDRKFMHSIDQEFERQKWFKVTKQKNGKYEKYIYIPLIGLQKYKLYYTRYFAQEDDKIQYIINVFRKEKTNFVEMIATLYACWLEIISNNEIFSENLILKKFYDWSLEKEKYEREEVLNGIIWIREAGITPII